MIQEKTVVDSFVDRMKCFFDDMEVQYQDDQIVICVNKNGLKLTRAVSIEAIIMSYSMPLFCNAVCSEINYAFSKARK